MLALGVLLPLLVPSLRSQQDAPARPNVVLVVSDDQGYADAGFMGSRDLATPELDALAASGAVLTAHYAQPLCTPSRAALLTGRLPTRTGVYTLAAPGTDVGLATSEVTLAQVLRAAGYETSLCGKWHLGSAPERRPTRRGFEHHYGFLGGSVDYFSHSRDGVPDWHRDDEPVAESGYTTELITREACRRIREKDPRRPLFLMVAYNAAHAPLRVPERYEEPFEGLARRRRTYAGVLAALDEGVGEIRRTLAETGLLDDTVFVFTSDNGGFAAGEVTDNSPLRAGKGSLYEGGIRTLTCVSWPERIPAGQRIDEPVQIVDWFPTLARLAGAAVPDGVVLDGLDVLPVLTSSAPSPHPWLLIPGSAPGRGALRVGDWKLVVDPREPGSDGAPTDDAEDGAASLFHLESDVGERRDLAALHPEKVEEMRLALLRITEGAVPPVVLRRRR